MTRLSRRRRFMSAAVRKSHVGAFQAQTENWSGRGEPLRQRSANSTASLRSVPQTLRNDAFESTFRCRSGSQVA
eukprot:11213051-Lingulodinium_polyedra.AAC.1